ncbi:hypothetical protein CPB84DRAFT_1649434, partial [Gymnopilus junonius]
PWCHFGCRALEDIHHIMLDCPRFEPIRSSARSCATGLFHDTDTWPAGESYYYLGVIPRIDLDEDSQAPTQNTSLHARLADNWHTLSIRLAGRIWGEV